MVQARPAVDFDQDVDHTLMDPAGSRCEPGCNRDGVIETARLSIFGLWVDRPAHNLDCKEEQRRKPDRQAEARGPDAECQKPHDELDKWHPFHELARFQSQQFCGAVLAQAPDQLRGGAVVVVVGVDLNPLELEALLADDRLADEAPGRKHKRCQTKAREPERHGGGDQ